MNKNYSILVVEDQDKQFKYLLDLFSNPPEHIIKRYKFDVKGAMDKKTALGLLKKYGFDLVILDLNIPDKKGGATNVEVGISLLKEIPGFPTSAVLVRSSYNTFENCRDVFERGAVRFIVKSEEKGPEHLFETVQNLVYDTDNQRTIAHLREELLRQRYIGRAEVDKRQQLDEFTKAASLLLAKVIESADNLRKQLRGRFGIDTRRQKEDLLSLDIAKIENATQEGLTKFRELRERVAPPDKPNEVDIKKEFQTIIDGIQGYSSSSYISIKADLRVRQHVLLYKDDFMGAFRECLMCAVENSQQHSQVKVSTMLSQKQRTVDVNINFQLLTNTSKENVKNPNTPIPISKCIQVADTLARSMGGQANCSKKASSAIIHLYVPIQNL